MIQRARGYRDATVHQHLDGLRVSSWLTSDFRRNYQPMAVDAKVEDVIATLHAAGIHCVLMGTHALNTWRDQARATQDVDILVPRRELRRTLRALQEAYPTLTLQDFPVVTRLIDPSTGKPVIDVMKPTQPVFQMVFRHAIPIGDTHRIPDLEMALVSKFAAMVSPHRSVSRKHIDAGDFANVVEHNRSRIDLKKLKRLGDKVYPDGGAEILRIIEDLDAGRMIQL